MKIKANPLFEIWAEVNAITLYEIYAIISYFIIYTYNLNRKKFEEMPVVVKVGRWRSAYWLAPRICFANREVGGSNLSVSTDDPLG